MTSIEVAIQQANYIIAQWISQDIEIREEIKKRILLQGLIYTKVKKTVKMKSESLEIIMIIKYRLNTLRIIMF
ncbi:hypothetical protein NWP96_04425 [Mycoplasmopsis cynos]|nr:hypothetical protein [Mycoplasmopsis cynos]